MSASVASSARTPARTDTSDGGGASFRRVVASEWTKITGLRSTWWTAAVTVVVSWLITFLSANASSGDPGFDPLASLPDGVALSQLGMLVLGVLVGTGEFRTGAFRTTFTAVPRRLTVLLARTVATAALAAGVALLCLVALVLGVLPSARSRDIALDLAAAPTPQVLLGCALMLAGMALLGLGLGMLLRRTVLAVSVALAVVFVLPVALTLVPDLTGSPLDVPAAVTDEVETDPVSTFLAFLPADAAFSMTRAPDAGGVDGAPDLGPWGGGLVFGAWVLVPLAAAGARLRSRDVT